MTEPDPIPSAPGAAPPPAAAKGGRWLKIALAVSLALNLGVAGLVAGAALRGGPSARDFGLGPLSEALSPEDRRALRKAFLDKRPELHGERKEMRAEFAALIAALRAEPLDAAALDAALQAIAQRNETLLAAGRELVAERLKAMDPVARAAFADRLEAGVLRMGRRDHDGHDDDD